MRKMSSVSNDEGLAWLRGAGFPYQAASDPSITNLNGENAMVVATCHGNLRIAAWLKARADGESAQAEAEAPALAPAPAPAAPPSFRELTSIGAASRNTPPPTPPLREPNRDFSAFYDTLRTREGGEWRSPRAVNTAASSETGKSGKSKKSRQPIVVSRAQREGKFSTFYQSLEQHAATRVSKRDEQQHRALMQEVQGSRKRTETGPIKQRPLSRGGSRLDAAPVTLELQGAPGDFGMLNGMLTREADKDVHG